MIERKLSKESSLTQEFADYFQSIDPKSLGLSKIEAISCSQLQGGHHNLSYLVMDSKHPDKTNRKFVIRYNPYSDNQVDHIAEEYKKLKNLDGLHAPKVSHLGRPDFIDSSVLIMQFVEGEHKDFNTLTQEEIGNFAQAIVDIHSTTSTEFTGAPKLLENKQTTHYDYLQYKINKTISTRLAQADPSIYAKDKEIIKKAQQELEILMEQQKESFSDTTFSYLHTDIVILNALWKDEKPTFIDWGKETFGDRADEIAYIFAINNTSEQFQQQFLDEYQKHVSDPTLHERIKVYMLKNKLFDLVWSISKLDEEASGNTMMKKEEGLYENFYNIRLKGLKEYMRSQELHTEG